MDELYRENILEHYKRPHNWGELARADLQAHDLNPLCGDELRVQSKSRDDLQATIALLKGKDLDVALQFVNFR